ncbi:MAG: lipoyl synthase [Candidatus Omnitrophica bacterium]|nr:lipoyl synthase [Candidatus Omnitrophota bacterium]MBI2496269.1 lipoyl synthase [Candidatus Omnitrophota bacterium]MBI3022038.1 lipoyl synthase [Candidatus Omnitrophota bacterium]MBI3082899.1 lipoyl synthase [Candidatus Omnitrophota bacterium]
MRHYPEWLKQPFSPDGVAREVRALVSDLDLATVCESALCPNLRECYSQRQLTFMILGGTCTRSCRFCAVDHGRPQPMAADEPWRVAEAVRRLGLRHVVITSVARDDLRDEGAGHWVDVIGAVRRENPGVTVETLVPDFHAREDLLRRVLEEGEPEVFAHNVETVERLSGLLRPQADYHRSLRVLRFAVSLGTGSLVKSSLMVGLGETLDEVAQTFNDLVTAGVTHVTIGQYLRPDAAHLPVMEYVSPERFRAYERLAYESGFRWVTSGPFVRSSYHAVDAISDIGKRLPVEIAGP